MARAVIRYGGGSDEDSKRLRGQIRDALADAGFDKVGTSSWNVERVPLGSICDALQRVATIIGSKSDSLEQLWVMVDRADERTAGE
jgi:hypothetical protein